MKLFINFLSTIMLLAFIASCSQDHGVDPKPEDPAENGTLQSDIQGKWMVETRSGRTTAESAFLEFLSDSTYIVYNIVDTVAVGKFRATGDTEISLTGFGSLSEIRFTNDKISFKLIYSGKTITITAGKAGIINADNRTKLLTRNWSITPEEDAAELINETTGIDKVTVLFTPSQTYLVQFFSKGNLVEAGMNNWKWHASDTNRFVYWQDGEDIKEGNFGTIHELTDARLKVTDNADGNPLTFVMVPTK